MKRRFSIMEQCDTDKLPVVRADADRLLAMAGLLDDMERQVVLGVVRDGLTLADIARAFGLPWYTVKRRYSCAVRRLTSPQAQQFEQHMIRLTGPQRELAVATVFRGLSYRKLAAKFGVTVHEIRHRLKALRATLTRLDCEWRAP